MKREWPSKKILGFREWPSKIMLIIILAQCPQKCVENHMERLAIENFMHLCEVPSNIFSQVGHNGYCTAHLGRMSVCS